MRKNTQWLLIITGCVTFMLACFCADNQPEQEYYDEYYEVLIRQEDGGNTDLGYYVVSPKPQLPLVIGSRQAYSIKNWEDDALEEVEELAIEVDAGVGTPTHLEPTKEGAYTIKITGKAFPNNIDRVDERISDNFNVDVVTPKRTVIEGLCASKTLAKGMEQHVSVRFVYDDQEDARAYGQGFYPFDYDTNELTIAKEPSKHTIRTMNVHVTDSVGQTVLMRDQLDNDRQVTFDVTTSTSILTGELLPLEEYAARTNNPSKQRVLLRVTLEDRSQICPHNFQLKSTTPGICITQSEHDTDEENNPINRRWFIKGRALGVCQLEITVDGLDGTITEQIMINKRADRKTETRTRRVPVPNIGRGGGGSGGADYD